MESKAYEMLFIILTKFSESERKTITDNIQNILSKSKATIIEFNDIGLKDFAMKLKKQDQGYYYQLRFSANRTQLELLQEDLKVNEKIFRHIIVTLDTILTKEDLSKIS